MGPANGWAWVVTQGTVSLLEVGGGALCSEQDCATDNQAAGARAIEKWVVGRSAIKRYEVAVCRL